MANYQMNYIMNNSNQVKPSQVMSSQVKSSQVKSIKVKMPVQKSHFTKPKMDKLVNFKAYLDYAIYNLDITPKEIKTSFVPSYRMVIPPKCYCCSSVAKPSQLTCDKYDCAIELLMEMSKKISADEKNHKVLVNKTSISRINGIYTNALSECISHMNRTMKIKYTKNCACCNHDIPYGLVVCRSVKCISKFIQENGEKYKEFRVEYNKKYNARKIAEEEDYYCDYYDNDRDYDYRDDYDDRRTEYSEPSCSCCNDGDGGGYYHGCSGCGTLRCGCIDVCRGRCGRDDDY
jgi:hypothetical protein